MPLIKGSSDEVVRENIAELRRSGYDEKQATAIAYNMKRDSLNRVADATTKKPEDFSGGEANDQVDRSSM